MSVQEQQVEQPTFTRSNSGNQFFNDLSDQFQDVRNKYNQRAQAGREASQALGNAFKEGTKKIFNLAGGDTLELESIGGKTTIWIFIGLSIAILIYIIVIAVWANGWFKKYVYNETTKEYSYIDEETTVEYKYIQSNYDNFTRVLNINKLIINCLLGVTALFGIIAFYGIGVGSGIKDSKGSDGKTKIFPVCGGKTFFWYFIPAITWFIMNCVWDMQHNTRMTIVTEEVETEGFCGMVETFCGNVSESFSNMKKAVLRKF